jgi:putative transposase
MRLAHRIRLDPTPAQRDYFARAAGLKANEMALKRQSNRIKYSDPDWLDADRQPWLRTIHRDAHAQPFSNLAKSMWVSE